MTHMDRKTGDETRVAFVDPRTGEILGKAPRTPDDGRDPEAVGTRIAILRPSARPPTAEFVPESGRKATGEVTSPWSTRRRSPLSRARNAAVMLAAAPRRRRAALAVALASLTAVAFAANLHARGGHRALRAQAAARPAPPPVPAADSSAGEAADSGVAPGRATLHAAVDAVAEGRFTEARSLYLALARENPRERSFALAAEILGRATAKAP
jgi:hypothetical protein